MLGLLDSNLNVSDSLFPERCVGRALHPYNEDGSLGFLTGASTLDTGKASLPVCFPTLIALGGRGGGATGDHSTLATPPRRCVSPRSVLGGAGGGGDGISLRSPGWPVDQTGFKLTENHCLCLPCAGSRGVHHHTPLN